MPRLTPPDGLWSLLVAQYGCTPPDPLPANTRRSANVVLMLANRLRCWANIKTTLAERLLFAGKTQLLILYERVVRGVQCGRTIIMTTLIIMLHKGLHHIIAYL